MAASLYARRQPEAAMAEINVTPLVDVMLVLLVIFMITAPALTRTLTMNLPIPHPDRPTPPPQVELRVGANGLYQLDGRALPAEALRGALASLAVTSPDTVLRVSAADDSEYQGFATALSAARESGIDSISLAN